MWRWVDLKLNINDSDLVFEISLCAIQSKFGLNLSQNFVCEMQTCIILPYTLE